MVLAINIILGLRCKIKYCLKIFFSLTKCCRYSEVDIIPCSADEPEEDRERQALRGAMLGYVIFTFNVTEIYNIYIQYCQCYLIFTFRFGCG